MALPCGPSAMRLTRNAVHLHDVPPDPLAPPPPPPPPPTEPEVKDPPAPDQMPPVRDPPKGS